MAKFLGKSNCNGRTPRQILEAKYKGSANNLLLVILFTVINIVLLVTNTGSYFLFSAFLPYYFVDLGMYLCGMYPQEYYYDVVDPQFFDKSFLIVVVAIAVVILLSYFLCWLFGRKKKPGFLIAALVLFVIDTIAMLCITGISTEMIMDMIFHVWVIVSLSLGIVNYFKLKKLPEEENTLAFNETDEQANYPQIQANSWGLRKADTEVKSRTLLQAEIQGYEIVYRRVKKVNELVVNGVVYDEYEAVMEFPHTLSAVVGGHKIEVQYDETSHMYILFDGEQIAKKLRLL
ncbi:MAG: hypothetical protein IJ025_06110 [Clostridia bacterium]|nr:hypothetical protein [Clostridia bacterium]